MNKKIRQNLLIFIGALLISATAGELIVRYLGHFDSDGNFFLRGHPLKPYRLHSKEFVDKKINEALASPNNFIIYDRDLGWAPKPDARSVYGHYRYNSVGIRSPDEYSLSPPPDTLRIMILGDSFTHGSDVYYEDSWGYQLERNLNMSGIAAEVLNLGVGGYGIDQAYLYWKKLGRRFSPHIVIFGFMAYNVKRNVNILRAILNPQEENFFSKPRFIYHNNALKLINSPTPPPEDIGSILDDFENWELAKYEFFFRPEKYENSFWLNSKLISFFDLAFRYMRGKLIRIREEDSRYVLQDEPAQISLRIIEAFKYEVERAGSKFLIVHLPYRESLKDLHYGNPLIYRQLLKEIRSRYQLIDPVNNMFEKAEGVSVDSLFIKKKGHYNAEGNKVIADSITKYLRQYEIHKPRSPGQR